MHMSAPPPLIAAKRPDIDPRYDRIVQRALSKNRDDRQSSMTELRAELKSLLAPPDQPPPSSRELPPPSAPSPVAVSAAPADDWIERGSGYIIDSATPAVALADRLVKDARSWLGELSRERNPRALSRRVEELEGAVRVLAHRADAKTLLRISAVVAGLAEGVEDAAGRTAFSAVARLFANPDLLSPVAMGLLKRATGQDPQRDAAAELITQAGVSGAVALYGARTKFAADASARVVFVTTMKSLGAAARPVLRGAFERIYAQSSTSQHRGATELTEDVLLSVPKGDDDLAGKLVVKFAASNVPSVARAAARALPRVWGIRARTVLLRLVPHVDDSVCLAAVIGLHELDAVDLDAVSRIGAQVDAGRVRTQQMSAAFATALASASASASAEAKAVLARMPR